MNKEEGFTLSLASKLSITVGEKQSTWYRFRQLIRWVFTGRADFKL